MAADAAPHDMDLASKLPWLAVGDPGNPFHVEVLDCRHLAQTYVATTANRSIAARFASRRDPNGGEFRGQRPAGCIATDCSLRFRYDGHHADGPLFVSQRMEDKWDFFVFDSILYCARSWTDLLGYVAELEFASDAVTVSRVHARVSDPDSDGELEVRRLHFLIHTYLGRSLIPFPIPSDADRRAVAQVALAGYAFCGCRALYGTTADLTKGPTG